MSAEHLLSTEALQRLLAGEAVAQDWQTLLDHLLATCVECRARASEVGQEKPLVAPLSRAVALKAEIPGLATLSTALQVVAERRLLGSLQWAELVPLAGRERLARVRMQPRFHHHGFVLACWENAERRGRHQPWAAVSIAVLGLIAAEHCTGPVEQVAALRTGAFLVWSETLIGAGDVPGAGRALVEARKWLGGRSDTYGWAAYGEQQARLAQEMGDLETALDLQDGAQELYQILGEEAEVGRVLLAKARLYGLKRSHGQAVELAFAGLSRLWSETSPRGALAAQVQLAGHLVDEGRSQEALALLEATTDLAPSGGEPERVQRLWVEARIARRLGAVPAAVPGFAAVATSLRSLRRHRDFALATLDLAEALQATGQTRTAAAALRRLAGVLRRQGRPDPMVSQLLTFAASLNEEPTGKAMTFDQMADGLVRHWWHARGPSVEPRES